MIEKQQTIEKHGHDPESLAQTSTKICILKCDYCGQIFERTMREMNRGNKKVSKDACKNKECRDKKTSEVYHTDTEKKINEINEKRNQTYQKNGTVNPFAREKIKEKIKETLLGKYGVEHALQSKELQEKRNKTMIERYGTLSNLDASGRKKEIIEKLRNKSAQTVEKGKKTSLERHGVENIGLLEETKIKRKETMLEKYGVENNSILQRVSYDFIEYKCLKKNYIPLFKKEDYKTFRQILNFKCLEHNLQFESRVENVLRDVHNCPKCKFYVVSEVQKEIFDFVKEIVPQVQLSNRSALGNRELDIYIENKQYAIEYDGLFWHCDLNKGKNEHQDKFKRCREKNIFLFQIYEDEWRDKRDICKSMIKNKLGFTENKSYATDFNIEISEKKKYNEFLDKNHLMGAYEASNTMHEICLSLVDKSNNIVCCVVARKLFAKQNENNKSALEIVRFGTLINTNVVGGFSRLLKHLKFWAKEQGFDKIVTYSDCRYSWGQIYQTNGFELIKKTAVNYYYTNNINRFPKYKFRAKNGISELEIIESLGLYKIYDAGKFVWELKL